MRLIKKRYCIIYLLFLGKLYNFLQIFASSGKFHFMLLMLKMREICKIVYTLSFAPLKIVSVTIVECVLFFFPIRYYYDFSVLLRVARAKEWPLFTVSKIMWSSMLLSVEVFHVQLVFIPIVQCLRVLKRYSLAKNP